MGNNHKSRLDRIETRVTPPGKPRYLVMWANDLVHPLGDPAAVMTFEEFHARYPTDQPIVLRVVYDDDGELVPYEPYGGPINGAKYE